MKKAGLPIQADAPDACYRNIRYARASRARAYGLYVTLRQLRHCIVGTVVPRHSVIRGLRVAKQCNRQNGITQPWAPSVPPSFLIIDRALAMRTRVHNSHRGVRSVFTGEHTDMLPARSARTEAIFPTKNCRVEATSKSSGFDLGRLLHSPARSEDSL